jgi:hypothetical protein
MERSNFEVGSVLFELGQLLLQGDTRQGPRAAYSRAVPIIEKKVGRDHPVYGLLRLRLAQLDLLAGQTKEAHSIKP